MGWYGGPPGSGGGGMAIGGAVSGSTASSILFIDGSTNLAQDPTNFEYDSTNKVLKLENQNAIYRVPNATGDNWFEGGAGNFTVSGYSNFGTGSDTLKALTSGTQNTAMGTLALRSCTSGSRNVAFGYGTLYAVDVGNDNFAIGTNSAGNITSGTGNFGFGNFALFSITTNNSNTAIGNRSLINLASGDSNTIIGSAAGINFTSGSLNTAFGSSAATAITSGDFNTYIGAYSGENTTGASAAVHIGAKSGANLTASTRNVFLGGWTGPSASVTDVIAISSGFNNSTGNGKLLLDYNYITANVWSYQKTTTAQGLHVYNTLDSVDTPTNYERACLDWNLTSNVFRLASQAGGTGVTRLLAIDGFSKAGAPAASDLPSGTFALIDDTINNQTWLVFNKGGTIRKVQLT